MKFRGKGDEARMSFDSKKVEEEFNQTFLSDRRFFYVSNRLKTFRRRGKNDDTDLGPSLLNFTVP